MRAAQVSERARPVALRVANGGSDAVGIGIILVRSERLRDQRLGEIGTPQREQPARALVEDVVWGGCSRCGRQSVSNRSHSAARAGGSFHDPTGGRGRPRFSRRVLPA